MGRACRSMSIEARKTFHDARHASNVEGPLSMRVCRDPSTKTCALYFKSFAARRPNAPHIAKSAKGARPAASLADKAESCSVVGRLSSGGGPPVTRTCSFLNAATLVGGSSSKVWSSP